MKAMIFAAGLGTRLRPATYTRPKALIEVNGIPLLEIVLTRLRHFGFHEIVINTHHFAEQIEAFLQKKNAFGLQIQISHESEELLDTGGGLSYARRFFHDGEPFLVHNVDILSDIDLQAFYRFHLKQQALATVAVSSRLSTRRFLFNQERCLCGWENRHTQERIMARAEEESALLPLAFSGLHVISPAIFDFMPAKKFFSIIEVYLQAAATERIVAFSHEPTNWVDVGKTENLVRAANILDVLS